MKIEHLDPFIKSASSIFKTMTQTDIEAGKPAIGPIQTIAADITGLVGLAGENVKGFIAIFFPGQCVLNIASNMLRGKFCKINDEVIEAVGEIINLIAGNARKTFSELGYKFETAIPSVIVGNAHRAAHVASAPVFVLPFKTEYGSFYIELCMDRRL